MRIKILGQGPGIAGYLKIGQPTPKDGPKRGAPEKFDHIEVTTRARNKEGQLEPDFQLMDALVTIAKNTESSMISLCGGCDRSNELGYPDGLPMNLGIYLASDDPEIAFPNRLCWYRGRHAYCWGDGEQGYRRKEVKKGSEVTFSREAVEHTPCGNECIDFVEGRCKPDARLRCSLAARELVGAVYEFRTTSWNSIRNIDACMKQVLELTRGTMSWVPLVFSLNEQIVQPRNGPANKAMVASLYFPGSAALLMEKTAQIHQRMGEAGRQLLAARASLPGGPSAWDEPPEEVAGFAAEFAPEERDADIPLDQGSEDGSGEENAREEPREGTPPQEEPADAAAAARAAAQEAGFVEICGFKLPGGRVCSREKDHVGKHSARAGKPKAEPPQEPAKQERPAVKEGKPSPADDRTNADILDPLTPFQIEQTRRLLREQGVASAPAARDWLVEKLGRHIGSMSEMQEQDFRIICQELDPKLFDQLYQLEIF